MGWTNIDHKHNFLWKGSSEWKGSWVRARARVKGSKLKLFTRARGPRTPFTPRTFFKGNCVHSSIVRFDLVNLRLRLLKFLLVYLLVSKDNGLGALRRRWRCFQTIGANSIWALPSLTKSFLVLHVNHVVVRLYMCSEWFRFSKHSL